MFLELLSAVVLGGGLIKDKIEQNQQYYGTSRDMHRNNPSELEHRRDCDEIIAKHKAEYIKKHGHSW